jgi:phosphatidylserine decarboxylase
VTIDKDFLLTLPQYLVPQHALSRLIGMLAATQVPLLKNTVIQWFAKRYGVDMSEAAISDLTAYTSFNDFFTRALRADARPISDADIVCPADGAISQIGAITNDAVFQAKGRHYSLTALLGGDPARAEPFINGQFATVYLSPKDYHRVHMPITGTLREMIYIPGKLFSVNTRTAEQVPNLFARNERVVALFDTAVGPMALVLVGAMIVASIETVWSGVVAPLSQRIIATRYGQQEAKYEQHDTVLDKGAEMGRFKLGSTVIVLFGKNALHWDAGLAALQPVRLGQALGNK